MNEIRLRDQDAPLHEFTGSKDRSITYFATVKPLVSDEHGPIESGRRAEDGYVLLSEPSTRRL